MDIVYLVAFVLGLVALIALIVYTTISISRKVTLEDGMDELEQAQVSAVSYDVVEFSEPEVEEAVEPVKPRAKRKAAKKKAAKKSVKKEKSNE